jgi:hypothetical protein
VQCLEYSKSRLAAFLEEVQRLKGAEFPYAYSENALKLIEAWFSGYLTQLGKLTAGSDAATIRAACAAELTGLFEYLPFLGFILRSTNPRNAFEVHGPLLRLAREIVKPNIKLIFSSEWDYSPLTYLGITHLPDYVLIGLPAPESDNPLLLPLAGHELGHSIWVTNDLSSVYGPVIEKKIVEEIRNKRWSDYQLLFPDVKDPAALDTDFFAQQTWSPAAEWGTRQAEETFCDLVGLRVFGESYLHAFAYLLAPKQLWMRSVLYPNLVKRVENLIKAAGEYKVDVPKDYRNEFEDLLPPATFDRQQTFLLSLADMASSSLADNLITKARSLIDSKVYSAYSESKISAVLQDFRAVAPATDAACLADILNAGWRAFHDKNLWIEIRQIQSKEKTLKELILKSIEVFEYEQLLKVPL